MTKYKQLVSIIVPTYKRDVYYLERCIKSLVEQTYDFIEIIVIDDNEARNEISKPVKNLVQSLNESGKLVYLKTSKNLGAALSRNFGIEYANGEYITFLDDDDIYLPNKIERQLKYMVDNNLDMCFTDLALYNSDDKLIDYRKHDYIKSLEKDELIKMHVMHNLTGTPTYMFKSDKLREIGGFDNSILSEEYYLMEKAINKGLKIDYLAESYVKAYRHKMGGESFGQRKIDGERLLFKSKKKYFQLLNYQERKYTRCRYYAVMAVSCFRADKYIIAVMYSFLAFIIAPITVIKELYKKRNLLQRYRRLTKDEE